MKLDKTRQNKKKNRKEFDFCLQKLDAEQASLPVLMSKCDQLRDRFSSVG